MADIKMITIVWERGDTIINTIHLFTAPAVFQLRAVIKGYCKYNRKEVQTMWLVTNSDYSIEEIIGF